MKWFTAHGLLEWKYWLEILFFLEFKNVSNLWEHELNIIYVTIIDLDLDFLDNHSTIEIRCDCNIL